MPAVLPTVILSAPASRWPVFLFARLAAFQRLTFTGPRRPRQVIGPPELLPGGVEDLCPMSLEFVSLPLAPLSQEAGHFFHLRRSRAESRFDSAFPGDCIVYLTEHLL